MTDKTTPPETEQVSPGRFRQKLHALMIRFDEWLCSKLPKPIYFTDGFKVSDEIINDFLSRLASGKSQAIYENGLPVPRSLFYHRFAILLLASNGKTRRTITTPYGFGSSIEILVPHADTVGPWGALSTPKTMPERPRG